MPRAFDRLKMVLTNAPLLTFPDFNRDFLLKTNASGIGLGAADGCGVLRRDFNS